MSTHSISQPAESEYPARRSGHRGRGRTLASRVALSVGIVFLVVGLLASYVQMTAVDARGFARFGTEALSHQDVRASLAQVIVKHMTQHAPSQVQLASPILQNAVVTVLGSDAFRSLFYTVLLHTHTVTLSERNNQIVLKLSKGGSMALAALSATDPQLATRLAGAQNTLQQIGGSNGLVPIIRALRRARQVAVVTSLLSLLCFFLAVVLSVHPARTLRTVGFALALPGAALWVLLSVGGWLAPQFVNGALSEALPGLWDAYFTDLRHWSLLLVAVGLLVAVLATPDIGLPTMSRVSAGPQAWLSGTTGSPLTVPVIGGGALALGVILLISPGALSSILGLLLGAAAVYWGGSAALGWLTTTASLRLDVSGFGGLSWSRWTIVLVMAAAVIVVWMRAIALM